MRDTLAGAQPTDPVAGRPPGTEGEGEGAAGVGLNGPAGGLAVPVQSQRRVRGGGAIAVTDLAPHECRAAALDDLGGADALERAADRLGQLLSLDEAGHDVLRIVHSGGRVAREDLVVPRGLADEHVAGLLLVGERVLLALLRAEDGGGSLLRLSARVGLPLVDVRLELAARRATVTLGTGVLAYTHLTLPTIYSV